VQAYTVTIADNGQTASLNAYGSAIPAGTPVVLKGDEQTFKKVYKTASAEAPESNALKGTSAATTGIEAYVLATLETDNGGTTPAFMQLSDGATIPANRAYIPAETVDAAKESGTRPKLLQFK